MLDKIAAFLYSGAVKTYSTTGTVNYCDKTGWITIQVDDSVVRYYAWWVARFSFKKVTTPYHGGHVTIVPAKHSGDFRKHPLWGRFHGMKVEVVYDNTIYTDRLFGPNRYFWIKVRNCPIIKKIRSDFGLSPDLKWPLHITCAYLGY